MRSGVAGRWTLELDSSYGCFCLELSGVKEWVFGIAVSIVDVTGVFLGVAVGDVF